MKVDIENFSEDFLKEGEAIPLFALRLGLAQAFPENEATKMLIVQQKFLNILPGEMKMQVDNTLMATKTSLELQIPWEQLVAIVDRNFPSKLHLEKGVTGMGVTNLTKPAQISLQL